MATTDPSAPTGDYDESEFPFTRGARWGLLALLLVTALFAGGILFFKYQLESFRTDVARGLEERFGARLHMGTIAVNGLRGLRIEDLRIEFPLEQGPMLSIDTPSAYINIQLDDLLQGGITVDRIVLDHSNIVLERPEQSQWFSLEEFEWDEVLPFEVSESNPFRITGESCRFHVRNIVGETGFDIEGFRFDIARLVDASDLTAVLQGHLSGDSRKQVNVRLSLASPEDFDIQIKSSLITAEDVNVLLPAEKQLVEYGAVHPTLWINGRPDRMIVVSLQAPFEDIVVRDQPEFLDPITGALTLLATYSADERRLKITTAKAESPQLEGNVEGTISFSDAYPEFDLRLAASQIPIAEILDYLMPGEIEDVGRMDLLLDAPHELEVRLTGSTQDPVLSGQTRSASGYFYFEPSNDDLPPATLALAQIEGAWDSYTQKISLAFDIADGTIRHDDWGLGAEAINGRVTLTQDTLTISPLNATVNGNAIVADMRYDLVSGDAQMDIEGTFSEIESTVFADLIQDTTLSGSVNLKGEAQKKGDTFEVTAQFDATQMGIEHKWWFHKPPGIAASGQLRAQIDPEKIAVLDAEGELASSNLHAELSMVKTPDEDIPWRIATVRATSDTVDLNAIAKCAILPYRITGGIGRLAYLEFRRDEADPGVVYQSMGCYIDELQLLPVDEFATTPITGSGVTLEIDMKSYTDHRSVWTGDARIKADALDLPEFGSTWLVPLTPPPDWPTPDRNWTIQLAATEMTAPPWKGRAFTARGYSTPHTSGLHEYRALVGDGEMSGSYNANREDRSYTAEVHWDKVPAHFVLEHLAFPDVLNGTLSGHIDYEVDRDDPNTLQGRGQFEVSDGRFSADYLYEFLEGQSDGDVTTLPPDLTFSTLRSDIEFAKDVVTTPNLILESPSIHVEGAGQYVRDGDLDYRLKVAVAPATAAGIPIMADNFNIQGHRLSGTPIELTFEIRGPTFNPKSEVAELPPASVTLMSGALEVTRDAISIIDLPRKVLIDLLKIGGGIVGSGSDKK